MERINNTTLKKYTGLEAEVQFECSSFGMANTKNDNSLSFIDTQRYLHEIVENKNIQVVISTHEFASLLKSKLIIQSNDPRFDYYSFLNGYSINNRIITPSIINPTAKIHPRAFVAEHNVIIGENTIVGANAVILEDVEIGANCEIYPGAVLGSIGFEYKRTSKNLLQVYHDGKVIIGNNVVVGSNTAIDKGFSFNQTIIGDNVKIDNLVHIAHGVKIEENVLVVANAMIAGSVEIAKESWVGPSSSIANGLTVGKNSFITLGSVVTKNVEDNGKVTGNFAIPHDRFLSNLKKSIS